MPEPVMNREPDDCAICATEYAAICFGVAVDRDHLKQEGAYHAGHGTSPEVTASLLSYGLQVIRTRAALPMVAKGEGRRGPDWNDPRCFDAVRHTFCHMLGAGFVGVTQTQIETPWDHAVAVEAMDGAETLTVVCSLRGRYRVSLREFVLGHEHKHGTEVYWVKGPDACTCRADADKRLATDRQAHDGCWCRLYPDGERCDCDFCRMSMNARDKQGGS